MAGKQVVVQFLGDARNLSKTFQQVPAEAEAMATRVTVAGGKGAKGLEQVTQGAGKASKGFSNLGGGLGTMLEGFAAAEAVKGFADTLNDDQHAAASLSQAMSDAGEKAGPEFTAKLKEAKEAGENLGFASADTVNSIAALREAGVSTSKAMEIQGTIMDLARAKNLTLADATKAVIMGMQGQGKALKELNVTMPTTLATQMQLDSANQALDKANTKATASWAKYNEEVKKYGPNSKQAHAAYQQNSKDNDALAAAQAKVDKIQAQLKDRTGQLGQVVDTLNKKVGGQAVKASQTAGGEFKTLQTKFMDTGAEVLQNLLPAFNKVIDALGFMMQHANVFLPILGTLIGAFIAWKVALGISSLIESVSKALEGLDKVMKVIEGTNPLVLAAIAIVGILVILEAKFHWIEAALNIMSGVFGKVSGAIVGGFHAVSAGAAAAIDWLKQHWPIVLEIMAGPFGLLVGAVIGHWGEITGFFGNAVGTIGAIFGSIGDAIKNALLAPFRAVAAAWNNSVGSLSFTIPGWVPLLGGKGFSMPKIPSFHTGGVVPGPWGAVVPILARAGEVVSTAGDRSAPSQAQTVNITVNVQGGQADPHAIAQAIAWNMRTRRS